MPSKVDKGQTEHENPLRSTDVSLANGYVIYVNAADGADTEGMYEEPVETAANAVSGANAVRHGTADGHNAGPGDSDVQLLTSGLLSVSPYVLWSILQVTGMNRLSVKQYMSLRASAGHLSGHVGDETALMLACERIHQAFNREILWPRCYRSANRMMTCKLDTGTTERERYLLHLTQMSDDCESPCKQLLQTHSSNQYLQIIARAWTLKQ